MQITSHRIRISDTMDNNVQGLARQNTHCHSEVQPQTKLPPFLAWTVSSRQLTITDKRLAILYAEKK